jgi:hypothetical protein
MVNTKETKKMNYSFIGQEFLLWLFWQTSVNGSFDLTDFELGEIELFFEDTISLYSVTGDGFSETITVENLIDNEFVFSSLTKGRIPSAAKLRIIKGKLEWVFQINSFPLILKSIKLPIVAKKDENEMISQRLYLMEMVNDIMTAIFHIFLEEREKENFVEDLKSFLFKEQK